MQYGLNELATAIGGPVSSVTSWRKSWALAGVCAPDNFLLMRELASFRAKLLFLWGKVATAGLLGLLNM
jgi:hypothetical protein